MNKLSCFFGFHDYPNTEIEKHILINGEERFVRTLESFVICKKCKKVKHTVHFTVKPEIVINHTKL